MSFTYDTLYSKGNRNDLITASIKEGCTASGNVNNLLNGIPDTTFYFVNGCSNVWILFSFNEPMCVQEIKWVQVNNSTHGKWKLQGSNDNSEFTDLGSEFVLTNGNFSIENNARYKYYKLEQIDGITSSSPWLHEVEFGIELNLYRYLIKQSNQYYTLKSEFYKDGKFTPLTLEGGLNPNVNDFKNFGFDNIGLLARDITIGTETFKPKDKLKEKNNGKFDILIKEI